MTADLTIGFGPIPGEFYLPCDAAARHRRWSHAPSAWNMRTGRSNICITDGDFTPHPQGCLVDFFVDFEFRNIILQKAIGAVFTEAVHLMVNAFLKRAAVVYGEPADVRPAGTSPLPAGHTE